MGKVNLPVKCLCINTMQICSISTMRKLQLSIFINVVRNCTITGTWSSGLTVYSRLPQVTDFCLERVSQGIQCLPKLWKKVELRQQLQYITKSLTAFPLITHLLEQQQTVRNPHLLLPNHEQRSIILSFQETFWTGKIFGVSSVQSLNVTLPWMMLNAQFF